MFAEDEQTEWVSVVGTKGKAEAMIRGTKKALQMAELPPDQTFAVHKAVKALQKLLARQEKDLSCLGVYWPWVVTERGVTVPPCGAVKID